MIFKALEPDAGTPAGAKAEATGAEKEPQLTDFEKRMFAAMDQRNAIKADERKQRSANMKKRPAAAVVQYDINNKPAFPTEHGTILYNNGKIYVNMKTQNFRVIRDAKTPRTERAVKWQESKPNKAEWAKALALIDEFWACPPSKKAKTQVKSEK